MKRSVLLLSFVALAATSCTKNIDTPGSGNDVAVVIPNTPHTPVPAELVGKWQLEGQFRSGIDVEKFWNYSTKWKWHGYYWSNGSDIPYRIKERKLLDLTDATGKKAKLYIYWQDYGMWPNNEYRAEGLFYVEGSVEVRNGQLTFYGYGGNLRDRADTSKKLIQRSFTREELETQLTATFNYTFPDDYTPRVMLLTTGNSNVADYYRIEE